jgi:hypothetical protein
VGTNQFWVFVPKTIPVPVSNPVSNPAAQLKPHWKKQFQYYFAPLRLGAFALNTSHPEPIPLRIASSQIAACLGDSTLKLKIDNREVEVSERAATDKATPDSADATIVKATRRLERISRKGAKARRRKGTRFIESQRH